MIRRFRCSGCGRYHNELPDCLLPYKHYEAEAISGVIDGVVTSDDLDSEDYPCVYTMLLWIRWFTGNLERIEGYCIHRYHCSNPYAIDPHAGWNRSSGPFITVAGSCCRFIIEPRAPTFLILS